MTAKFATPSLAEAYAIKLACSYSVTTGRARLVPFARVLQAADGSGPAFAVRRCGCGESCPDYVVVEVGPTEIRALTQAGMLRAAEDLEARATENETEADELRVTGKQRQRMNRLRDDAERYRAEAESLRVQAVGMGLVAATLAEEEREAGAAE